MSSELMVISNLARLIQPLIKDLYEGAKRTGVKGLFKWELKGYTLKLGRRILAIEDVRTIWKPDGPISLREFFHPPKLIISGKPVMVSRVSQLPSNAIIVEGIVGQGKSILLRSLASEEVRSNDAKRLPIFIELKNLNSKLDLRLAIHKHLESYDAEVDEDTLDYLYRAGKVVLMLDGFDEIEESLIKQTYLDIEHLSLRYPDLQIVVSSRPGHEIQKSSRFRALKIAQLIPAEFPAFLSKLKVNSEKSLSLREAIKSSPSKISSLITTPLMLTMVVVVYEAESQIPETLPEFFERLFNFVFTRHDHLKAGFTRKHHSGLSERRLQTLFEAFSFMTLQLGYGRTLSQVQFHEVFDHAIGYCEDSKCESEKFKKDITKVACLMLEEGIDSITFLHQSILEYYAAAFVKGLGDENACLFYKAVTHKSQGWEEVLTFLKLIDGFRFARHYLLPIIEKHREVILTPAKSANDKALIALIAKIYPGVGVYFRVDSSDTTRVQIGAIGNIKSRPGEEIGNMGFLILDSLSEMVPSALTLEDLRQTFNVDPESAIDDFGVHVPITSLLMEYGTKELKKALNKFETILIRLETQGRATVGREEKKGLIFLKPT